MKKIMWIVIIALIVCGVFFLYKEGAKKTVNNENEGENISTDANITENNESKANETKKDELKIEDVIKKSEEENSTQNEISEEKSNTVEEKNNTTQTNKVQENKIKEMIAPSGFMGSSLLRVALYDNGEVYLIRYNGEGYEDKNIENKELLASNASEIKSKGSREDFEAIVIKGSSKLKVSNNNYSWIEFEK